MPLFKWSSAVISRESLASIAERVEYDRALIVLAERIDAEDCETLSPPNGVGGGLSGCCSSPDGLGDDLVISKLGFGDWVCDKGGEADLLWSEVGGVTGCRLLWFVGSSRSDWSICFTSSGSESRCNILPRGSENLAYIYEGAGVSVASAKCSLFMLTGVCTVSSVNINPWLSEDGCR